MEGETPAPSQNTNCFGCGADNPHGLKIDFYINHHGAACARWIPARSCESFPGTIHGGLLTTAMDEAMAKAILATGTKALTCELRVRLHESVRPNDSLEVRGWIVKRNRRLIHTEASILNASGAKHAHAWATFLVPQV
jgi:acyl-CoA hydrolase